MPHSFAKKTHKTKKNRQRNRDISAFRKSKQLVSEMRSESSSVCKKKITYRHLHARTIRTRKVMMRNTCKNKSYKNAKRQELQEPDCGNFDGS